MMAMCSGTHRRTSYYNHERTANISVSDGRLQSSISTLLDKCSNGSRTSLIRGGSNEHNQARSNSWTLNGGPEVVQEPPRVSTTCANQQTTSIVNCRTQHSSSSLSIHFDNSITLTAHPAARELDLHHTRLAVFPRASFTPDNATNVVHTHHRRRWIRSLKSRGRRGFARCGANWTRARRAHSIFLLSRRD